MASKTGNGYFFGALRNFTQSWGQTKQQVFGCYLPSVCLMLHLVISAPADASTEDAAAHATGNGVASEVGRCHAHRQSLSCNMCCIFCLFLMYSDIIPLLVFIFPSEKWLFHPFPPLVC